jgi:hypothetical protein
MASALAIENNTGQKRVLPLILNSKTRVLKYYPLLLSLNYREYIDPPDTLADEIMTLARKRARWRGELHIIVESIHTGQICNIQVSPKVSVRWLVDNAQKGLGFTEEADTGAYIPFRVRWVLVDVRAEKKWLSLPRRVQRGLRAAVQTKAGLKLSRSERDRLEDIGIYDGIVFHLYQIEDEDYGPGGGH